MFGAGPIYPSKGKRLSKTVAFLAEIQGSPSLDEQKAGIGSADYVLLAGKRTFTQLGELLMRSGVTLVPGDRVKIFDLSCLALSTTTLIRALAELLRNGITVEVVVPGITLEASDKGQNHALLEALDGHYRHMHGIKTHPIDTAPQGRKRLLNPDQLPAIRAMLDKEGATATNVALELGVARSTLFNYLDRYDGDRSSSRAKTAPGQRPGNAGNDIRIPERNAD